MWSTIALVGFVVLVAGFIALVRPIPPLLPTRGRAALVMLGGFVLWMVGALNAMR